MSAGSFKDYPVGENDLGRRLDRVVRRFLPTLSLGMIYAAIRRGEIRVNGRKGSASRRLARGDRLEISESLPFPVRERRDAPPLPDWFAEAVLFEDSELLAINKPRGVLVHGPGSLQQAALAYLHSSGEESLSFTPAPLHRLDRNSSGILLVGKSLHGAQAFTALLRAHAVRKEYLVLLTGKLTRAVTWTDRLKRDSAKKRTASAPDGRPVSCTVRPITAKGGATVAIVSMDSGFTHQIRAQTSLHGHPLRGDRKYGGGPGGFLLHAGRLSLADRSLGFQRLSARLPRESAARLLREFGRQPLAQELADLL